MNGTVTETTSYHKVSDDENSEANNENAQDVKINGDNKEAVKGVDDFDKLEKIESKGWGYRHQQCFILFCCLTTAYSMRACMGVSLVAMVDRGPILKTSNFTENMTNIRIELNNTMSANQNQDIGLLDSLLLTPPYPKFQWSKMTQDMILSSFFWGYMLLQIPSGQLAHFSGTRYMLTGALAINAVVSFTLPWAAQYTSTFKTK